MHPAARASLFLAVAATALATAGVQSWTAGDVLAQIAPNATLDNAMDIARDIAREVAVRLQRWVETGYAKRPAVILGLGGALVLPFLVMFGLFLYRRQTPGEHFAVPSAAGVPGLYAVRIEVEGASIFDLPGSRQFLQIGRQDDNDICIRDETVSRYHAVLERSGDSGITITDVSSPDGGGLFVNGERRSSAVLSDGDLVEMGRSRMRIAAA